MSNAHLAPPNIDLRRRLQARYPQVRQHSMQLIAPLSAEDCALQAAPFVSPAKWHLAHTTWFFETFILLKHVAGYSAFNPQYQVLFNSYYNGVGEQFSRPQRHLLSRPSLTEVRAYRQHIDAHLQVFLTSATDAQLALIELGLHHEQQHQELLLMDLKYSFFQNPLLPRYREQGDELAPCNTHTGFQPFAGGLYEMGASGDAFCFDNETPRHQTYIQPFQLSRSLVSNGEYQGFIDDGGYQQPLLWLSDGWAWRQQQNVSQPLYWVKRNNAWFEYTLQGLVPLDPDQAVSHISFYEADAFAQWQGCRLPSEAEWEVAAHSIQAQSIEPTTQAHTQLAQMFDHHWQWTQSAYQPYPGFKTVDGAVGEYNGKFMCNQMVLRGGCDLTPKEHSRITYRNFFYPQDQWPKTGIRLAKNEHL